MSQSAREGNPVSDSTLHSSGNMLHDMLFGFIGCISDKITCEQLFKACLILEQATDPSTSNSMALRASINQSDLEHQLSRLSLLIAQDMCRIGSVPDAKRKQTWDGLLEFSARLQAPPVDDSNALAISLVFGALSLLDAESAKGAASAMSSTVSRNKPLRLSGQVLATRVLSSYLGHASHSDTLNLHIVTQFARAFKLTEEDNALHARLVAEVVRHALRETCDADATSSECRKQATSAALALVCQVRPWSELDPMLLVEAAIPYSYWHAAEKVCLSAHNTASSAKANKELMTYKAIAASQYLIDTAMEERSYRRADSLATSLYEQGGKSRYIEARFCHACDTIAKVAQKRQFPIIERQVDRIDKAIIKVHGSLSEASDDDQVLSREIRTFAMDKLHEIGEYDAAQRLADLWGMDYVCDEQSILAAAAARRKHYLQFDEVLQGDIPNLVSTPSALRDGFATFWKQGPYPTGPFGFDAEWEEDSNGAELLQLSHPKQAMLIDIPALSSTSEGVIALKDTVGALFECPKSVVVGFSCHHDISRLRGSPCFGDTHWLTQTQALVDAQRLVAEREPDLKRSNTIGLSRVCQYYFGKPLDKSEQCSIWGARPLLEKQRSYAALDAWVCAGVYEKLFPINE